MSLGRGLGALLVSTASTRQKRQFQTGGGKPAEPADAAAVKVWYIPLTELQPNSRQPRRDFNPEELTEMADSIRQYGILQPLLVTERADGGYELVAGERRWRAAKIAGLTTVPAVVKELADQEKLEVALVENIQRKDLNPIEEAFAYKRLVEEFHLQHKEIAAKVGKARPTVSNTIRLLGLPEQVQTALIEGRIGASQARTLLGMPKKEQQLAMLSSMLGEKMTVSELEREVCKKKEDKSHLRRDPNLLFLEDKLRAILGTKVFITRRRRRGTITIEYYSQEELEKIVKKLLE